MPEDAVLIVAGFQVPVIPLFDVRGNVPGAAPTQYGPSCVKVGVITEFTTTVIVVEVPHWPTFGVKVYTVVPADAVLMVAGLQVPVIPLLDVAGKVPGAWPIQ